MYQSAKKFPSHKIHLKPQYPLIILSSVSHASSTYCRCTKQPALHLCIPPRYCPVIRRIDERTVPYLLRACEQLRLQECNGMWVASSYVMALFWLHHLCKKARLHLQLIDSAMATAVLFALPG
ncbi:hypothetical protein TNCV_333811 [Trichonephila clavipes]|nr:hypothetical protein TNCV_333811 [Trichonephila clavipes]